MPAGQSVRRLPSLVRALGENLAVQPDVLSPLHWRAVLVPNLDDWQPGDIVLAWRADGPGLLIAAAQRLLLPAQAQEANWTHCGIYLGGGSLVDAAPGRRRLGGVRQRSLEEFCNVRTVAVLRLEVGGYFISPSIGTQVANAAAALIGKKYAAGSLAAMAARYLGGGFGLQQMPLAPIVKAVYCSSLVVVAYRAIGITLDLEPLVSPCLPANLHAHSQLWSMDTHWHGAI